MHPRLEVAWLVDSPPPKSFPHGVVVLVDQPGWSAMSGMCVNHSVSLVGRLMLQMVRCGHSCFFRCAHVDLHKGGGPKVGRQPVIGATPCGCHMVEFTMRIWDAAERCLNGRCYACRVGPGLELILAPKKSSRSWNAHYNTPKRVLPKDRCGKWVF